LFSRMRTSKQKANEQFQGAPTIRSAQLPPASEQIHQRNSACAAHASAERMTLNDWRDVEQEVKRKLENE